MKLAHVKAGEEVAAAVATAARTISPRDDSNRRARADCLRAFLKATPALRNAPPPSPSSNYHGRTTVELFVALLAEQLPVLHSRQGSPCLKLPFPPGRLHLPEQVIRGAGRDVILPSDNPKAPSHIAPFGTPAYYSRPPPDQSQSGEGVWACFIMPSTFLTSFECLSATSFSSPRS